MTTIHKNVIQITVFSRGELDFRGYTLHDILDECENGDMIRSPMQFIGSSPVHPEVLASELQDIGNDGTFFDD